MDKHLEKESKYLSYLLRHHPEDAGCDIDKFGWVDVATLIRNSDFNRERLSLIVSEDTRYEFSSDGEKIRAFHGHSVKGVEPYIKVEPKGIIFHGTSQKNYEQIQKDGAIWGMSRNYVHLSYDETVAKAIGSRHGKPVILVIDAVQMIKDGYQFYDSGDNVVLIKEIPVNYIIDAICY